MASHANFVGRAVETPEPIRSIELAGGRVSLLFRRADLDVQLVEVAARGSVSDASLWGEGSWHFVVEGRALLEQGGQTWEVLPSHWLALADAQPYRIVNPAEGRLRLLSVVAGAAANGTEGAA